MRAAGSTPTRNTPIKHIGQYNVLIKALDYNRFEQFIRGGLASDADEGFSKSFGGVFTFDGYNSSVINLLGFDTPEGYENKS